MNSEVFKRNQDIVNRHLEVYGSGPGPVDVILSGNKSEIDKLIENKTITRFSAEVITFLLQNNIPFEDVSRQDRLAKLERSGELGAQFTKSSSSLIEILPRRNSVTGEISDFDGHKTYGLKFLDLEDNLHTYFETHPKTKDLTYEERYNLVQDKLIEFLKKPETIYPGIKKLNDPKIRSLKESLPEDMSEGTKLYLFLYSQMFYPLTETPEYQDCPRFEVKGGSYYFCKNAEILFNTRLDPSDRSSSTVFESDGKPILIQKTGEDTILEESRVRTTNATAINLEPIFVSGILYPPGTLFGVTKKGGNTYVKNEGNQVYETSDIEGLVPLRLSVFSISPDEKERQAALGIQYDDFKEDTLSRGVEEGSIDRFRELALRITSSS